MFKITSLFVCTLLTLALTSCGQKNDGNIGEQSNTFKIESTQKLSDFTNTLQLDSNTPVGLSTLLSLIKTDNSLEVAACTSFLIDRNTIITNSHCIPQAIKDNSNQDCSELIQFVIKTDNDVVRTKCQKVITFSSLSENVIKNNDYAIVRITNNITLSRYFNLDRSGFSEDEKTSVLTLNHALSDGVIVSSFIEHHCIVKSSDTFGTINSLASSPLAGFKDPGTFDTCKIVHGNSGSPVVKNNNSVSGIIHAGYFPSNTNLNESTSTMAKVTSYLGILTNFRCQKFNLDFLDRDIPSSCSTESINSNLDETKIEKRIDDKLQDFSNRLIQTSPSVVLYNVKSNTINKDKILISIAPKCVLPIEQWSQVDQSNIQNMLNGNKVYQFTLLSYSLGVTPDFDYYGNLNIKLNTNYSLTDYLELSNLQKINSNKMATLKSLQSNGRDNVSSISICQ